MTASIALSSSTDVATAVTRAGSVAKYVKAQTIDYKLQVAYAQVKNLVPAPAPGGDSAKRDENLRRLLNACFKHEKGLSDSAAYVETHTWDFSVEALVASALTTSQGSGIKAAVTSTGVDARSDLVAHFAPLKAKADDAGAGPEFGDEISTFLVEKVLLRLVALQREPFDIDRSNAINWVEKFILDNRAAIIAGFTNTGALKETQISGYFTHHLRALKRLTYQFFADNLYATVASYAPNDEIVLTVDEATLGALKAHLDRGPIVAWPYSYYRSGTSTTLVADFAVARKDKALVGVLPVAMLRPSNPSATPEALRAELVGKSVQLSWW
jgi:hypothetical protein